MDTNVWSQAGRCLMRALVFDGKTVRFTTAAPVPVAAEGEVLVRVELAGICQTDLEIAKGYMGFTGILGHEFTGRVERLGKNVAPEWLGQRVCGEINCVCGKCEMCAGGLSTHCTRRSVIGIQNHDGAFAEFLALPARNLHAVPAHVSAEEAVFVEPLAAAFQILRQVPIEKRTRVTVLGDGRLGQLVAQTLVRTGCALTLVGHHEDKLTLAEKLCAGSGGEGKGGKAAGGGRGAGFRTVLERELRASRDQDVVVDCTGRAAGFQRALGLLRPRGILVLKTTVAQGVALDLAPIVIDELTVLGSRCGPFGEALRALAAREVRVTPLISRRVSLERAAPMLLGEGMAGTLKVVIQVAK